MLLPLKQASAGHSSGNDRFLPRTLEGCGGFALLDMVIAIIILGAVAAFAAETLWSAGRSYAEMRSYRDGFHKAVNCMEALAVEFEKNDYGEFFSGNDTIVNIIYDNINICQDCSVSRRIAKEEVNSDGSVSITGSGSVDANSAAGRLIHVTVTPSSGAPSLTRLFGK